MGLCSLNALRNGWVKKSPLLSSPPLCISSTPPGDRYVGQRIEWCITDLKAALNKLVSSLSEITPAPDIILGGDFNLPHVSWPEGEPNR